MSIRRAGQKLTAVNATPRLSHTHTRSHTLPLSGNNNMADRAAALLLFTFSTCCDFYDSSAFAFAFAFVVVIRFAFGVAVVANYCLANLQ